MAKLFLDNCIRAFNIAFILSSSVMMLTFGSPAHAGLERVPLEEQIESGEKVCFSIPLDSPILPNDLRKKYKENGITFVVETVSRDMQGWQLSLQEALNTEGVYRTECPQEKEEEI